MNNSCRKEKRREGGKLASARIPSLLWVELHPLKRCVEVLTPVFVNVILFGNRVLGDVNNLR